MKHPFNVNADLECLLKKTNNLKKKYQQLKNINIKLLVIQYLHSVNLMQQKIS